MIVSSYGAACMQYSSDFTKVMREAGYIYPFDWRRRRMDQDYEEPQGTRISEIKEKDTLRTYFPCETG